MDYKIFLETLILTLLTLVIGIGIGYFIESYRADQVIQNYKTFEIDSLDLKLQSYYFQTMDSADCKKAIEQNIKFADDIYQEGLLIQKYEDEEELRDNMLSEKKRYVLLKTELWLNSMLLKKKCGNPFHTVVYVYSQEPTMEIEAEQLAISKTLEDIKKEKGNEIILIPIAGDLNLRTVEILLENYDVKNLPSILIDENKTFEGFSSAEAIKKYL